jgi:general secretion pathway protein G
MKIRSSSTRQAFTLLEIMLVVAIIALLLGAGFHYMGNTFGIAQDARLQSDIATFESKLKLYEAMNGALPTTEQGLQALVTMPDTDPKPVKWYQLMEKLPKDPWGSNYIYEQPGKHNQDSYDVYSPGKDRTPNTPDDVGNWEEKKQ